MDIIDKVLQDKKKEERDKINKSKEKDFHYKEYKLSLRWGSGREVWLVEIYEGSSIFSSHFDYFNSYKDALKYFEQMKKKIQKVL